MSTFKDNDTHNALRRSILAGILSSCAIAYLPMRNALAVASASNEGESPDFAALSRYLTGHTSLEPTRVQKLYTALKGVEHNFDAQLKKLSAFIDTTKAQPSQIQTLLDTQAPDLAHLPKIILAAWYIGVVGKGAAARCVSFETSLMYLAVADRVKPPSYAYGPYGSWSRKPAAS